MYDWQLIFGDCLPDTVNYIREKALEKSTVESLTLAINQLDGIECLMTDMQCKDIIGPDATMRIGAVINKLKRLREATQEVEAICNGTSGTV